ncbi:MAG: hypothetical protein QNK89_06955 [Lacinutrix sp.]|uniref:hypothetical protein n=1 Tax=Lacinutrix sp. TaxID=1937692 RepID=UPI0030AA57CE
MKFFLILFLFISQFGFSQNYTEYHTGSTIDMVVTPNSGVCLMGGVSESDCTSYSLYRLFGRYYLYDIPQLNLRIHNYHLHFF